MSCTNPDELSTTVRELLGMDKPDDPGKVARQSAPREEFDTLKTAYDLNRGSMSLAKLRELAEKAAPGPWHVTDLRDAPDGNRDCIWVDAHSEYADGSMSWKTVAEMTEDEGLNIIWGTADAEFIASANPTVVLALLDEIEALRHGQGSYEGKQS